jgi:hypothetical protein
MWYLGVTQITMSSQTLHESEVPLSNHEYFRYEITEKEYEEDPPEVETVVAIRHDNGTGHLHEIERLYLTISW